MSRFVDDDNWDLRGYAGAQRKLAEMSGGNVRSGFYGWNDLVAQLGTEYKGQPLPDCFEPGERQRCYANSLYLAERISNLRYVEGLATGTGLILPLPHAWCIDEHDRVIDVTWTGEGDRTQGVDYLGIVIPTSYVRKAVLRNKMHWSVLDADWLGGNVFIAGEWREVLGVAA